MDTNMGTWGRDPPIFWGLKQGATGGKGIGPQVCLGYVTRFI